MHLTELAHVTNLLLLVLSDTIGNLLMRSTSSLLEGLRSEVPSLLREPPALEPAAETSSLWIVIWSRVAVVARLSLVTTHQLAKQACNALKCWVDLTK